MGNSRLKNVMLALMISMLVLPNTTLALGSPRDSQRSAVAYSGAIAEHEPVGLEQEPEPVDILDLRPAAQVPRDEYSLASTDSPYCLRVNEGTLRTTWRIENPAGIGAIPEAQYANYEQNILSQSSTSIVLELISTAELATNAPYPVNTSGLPSEILAYLGPETMAQSEAPEIVTLANQLVLGSQTQAKAVESVHTWVGSQISYDYTLQLPNDAMSVLEQRAGVCSGYSWLTVALLRAVGIPARYTVGCVGWSGDQGTLHAWVEIYYPDAGWVQSEPQASANYLHTPGYILGLLGMCSDPDTTVTRLSTDNAIASVVSLETEYSNDISYMMDAASVPAITRSEIEAVALSDSTALFTSDPTASLDIAIDNLRCRNEDWRIESGSSWLVASEVQGLEQGTAHVDFSVQGLEAGDYQAQFNIYASLWDLEPAAVVLHDIQLIDMTTEPPSQEIPLEAGWNLIGISCEPAATDIQKFIEPLAGNVSSVLAWDATQQAWQRYTADAPSYANNLGTVGEGQGLWVLVDEASTLPIWSASGSTGQAVALSAGWNMVGYTGASAMDIDAAIASVDGQFSAVLTYGSDADPTWYQYDPAADPASNTLSVLEPGRGYWIEATQNCVWTLPS